MRFKAPELVAELGRAHPQVVALALYLDRWFTENCGHDGMLTDVERTQAEYNQVYGVTPYLGPRPHLVAEGVRSHAVDWRSTEFTKEEIHGAQEHMNHWFPRKDGKETLMYHQVAGNVYHFHLQAEV